MRKAWWVQTPGVEAWNGQVPEGQDQDTDKGRASCWHSKEEEAHQHWLNMRNMMGDPAVKSPGRSFSFTLPFQQKDSDPYWGGGRFSFMKSPYLKMKYIFTVELLLVFSH